MSARWAQVRNVYRDGATGGKEGWCCSDCHRQFLYSRHSLVTYVRLVGHLLAAHRRLPKVYPGRRCLVTHGSVWHSTSGTVTWTFTHLGGAL